MAKPRVTVERRSVKMTTVECPKKFTVSFEVTEFENGSTSWSIRGFAYSRGRNKLARFEDILRETVVDPSLSRGAHDDWFYWGRDWDPVLEALIDEAADFC